MAPEKKPVMPLNWVILDSIGAILVGLGIAKLFGDIDLIPESLRYENYGVGLVVIGIALMVPFLKHLFSTIREKQRTPLP